VLVNAFQCAYRTLPQHVDSVSCRGFLRGSYTEMITDRYLDFKFDAAMLLLAHTRKTLQTALSTEAAALLDKMEAFVR
jgi:hypothetical protein